MGSERLDDRDYPILSMGQAAELLGVTAAFLRSLDAADLLHPQRSGGGHRRYTRRQLDFAAQLRELAAQGHTIAGAAELIELRGDLADAHQQRDTARAERDQARAELAQAHQDLQDLQDLGQVTAQWDQDDDAAGGDPPAVT